MSEHTPWRIDGFENNTRSNRGFLEAIIRDATGMEVCRSSHFMKDRHESNARLIAAAVNSYDNNCENPVEAAESDLLGRALDSLSIMTTLVRLKYGNLDNGVYKEIEIAEDILKKRKKDDE